VLKNGLILYTVQADRSWSFVHIWTYSVSRILSSELHTMPEAWPLTGRCMDQSHHAPPHPSPSPSPSSKVKVRKIMAGIFLNCYVKPLCWRESCGSAQRHLVARFVRGNGHLEFPVMLSILCSCPSACFMYEGESLNTIIISGVALLVLRPLLAYCTSPRW
jgi:hypothetical protein